MARAAVGLLHYCCGAHAHDGHVRLLTNMTHWAVSYCMRMVVWPPFSGWTTLSLHPHSCQTSRCWTVTEGRCAQCPLTRQQVQRPPCTTSSSTMCSTFSPLLQAGTTPPSAVATTLPRCYIVEHARLRTTAAILTLNHGGLHGTACRQS